MHAATSEYQIRIFQCSKPTERRVGFLASILATKGSCQHLASAVPQWNCVLGQDQPANFLPAKIFISTPLYTINPSLMTLRTALQHPFPRFFVSSGCPSGRSPGTFTMGREALIMSPRASVRLLAFLHQFGRQRDPRLISSASHLSSHQSFGRSFGRDVSRFVLRSRYWHR